MQMQSGVCPRRPLLSRQLSLHQNVGLPEAPPLRRQSSEEHRRPTRPRQAWTMSSERRASATSAAAVELVAKRVEKPVVLQHPAHLHPPQQELVAALATRQELAERLRRAWREGQAKQGLNIFLAQAAREEKPEDTKINDDVDVVSTEFQPSKERLEIVLTPSAPNSPPRTKESSSTSAPVRALSAGAKRVNFRNSKTTSSSLTSATPPIPNRNKPLRVKSARRRHRKQDSSEDENHDELNGKKTPGRRGVPARSEIITQISLMSSSDSEGVEDSSTNPPLESPKNFIQQLQQPMIMSLRKSQKTVSFLKNENCETNQEEASPVTKSESPPVIIRPQSSILTRRRPVLERQSSAPADINAPGENHQSTPNRVLSRLTDQNPTSNSSESSTAAGGTEQPVDLRSPKERECWILYRRMVDKGIAVSFDTILRGMLTPTEYRQRLAAGRTQKKCLDETFNLIEGLNQLNTK